MYDINKIREDFPILSREVYHEGRRRGGGKKQGVLFLPKKYCHITRPSRRGYAADLKSQTDP